MINATMINVQCSMLNECYVLCVMCSILGFVCSMSNVQRCLLSVQLGRRLILFSQKRVPRFWTFLEVKTPRFYDPTLVKRSEFRNQGSQERQQKSRFWRYALFWILSFVFDSCIPPFVISKTLIGSFAS